MLIRLTPTIDVPSAPIARVDTDPWLRSGASRLRVWTHAREQARKIARVQLGEAVIHGRAVPIRDSDSYGNDRTPPRDTVH